MPVRLRFATTAVAAVISATLLGHASHTAAVPTADERAIVHLLNRVGFGPVPGQVARIRQSGIDAYIAAQLALATDKDTQVEARLSPLRTVTMSSRELAEAYFVPAMRQRILRQRQSESTAGAESDRQRLEPVTTDRLVLMELTQQKLLRAIHSERQLEEVMTDFWFNHFNVFAMKGATRVYLTEYERDVIRPHVLGRFRDLLGAVAESPAMLFYLDNWQSSAPLSSSAPAGRRPGAGRPGAATPQAPNRQRGINENYARELMELHTLGVDGGYSQRDVQEVARAFTGWTIDMPRQGGGFRFDPRRHDDGEKVVLGVTIPRGGGKRDGEQVLDLLARHPATARFIATKLARRFVSDDPPPALVERAAAVFRATDGDIREVVRAIVTSPEFSATAAYRAKVKTPFEFVVSAVRAAGPEIRNGQRLVQAMRQLGMPLYLCAPPTGYADTADAWINAGALLNRMNVAVALTTGGAGRGARMPISAERIVREIMADDVAEATRATVARASSEPQRVALLLGSPDFQKR